MMPTDGHGGGCGCERWWTWKPPPAGGNAQCIGMLVFHVRLCPTDRHGCRCFRGSSPLVIGLSAPMILWAVPMVKLAQSALHQGLW